MKLNLSFLSAVALFLTLNVCAENHPLTSGVYEQMKLAVSSSGEVTGYYFDSMGDGVSQSCTFTLHGKAQSADNAIISAHSAQDYPGTLIGTASGVILSLHDGQQQPGCMNLLPPDIATGIEFERSLKTEWQTLAQVATEKAYLHRLPAADGKAKGWLVKNDVVGIITTKPGWSQVQFVNNDGKSTIAWVENPQLKMLPAAATH